MAIATVHPSDNRALQDIADCLARAKKVLVVTGAGISTSCGIPDFRSRDGLYDLIESDYRTSAGPSAGPRGVQGKDLFDARLWRDSHQTAVFYRFVTTLRRRVREDVHGTGAVHKLLRVLRDRRALVRCYTQNIDGLEARERLSTDLGRGSGNRARFTKPALASPHQAVHRAPGAALDGGCEVVPLHGDLESLRCTLCPSHSAWEPRIEESFRRGEAVECPACAHGEQVRLAQGKRGRAVGTLRPNIVLYGEEHPAADLVARCVTADLRAKADVLLICGTSLKVHGLKNLVREFAKSVHERKGGRVIFVNATAPAESVWRDYLDCWVDMDLDRFVGSVRKHRPDIWQQQLPITATHLQITKTLNNKLGNEAKVCKDGATDVSASELSSVKPPGSAAYPGTPRQRDRPRKMPLASSVEAMEEEVASSLRYPTPPPTKRRRSLEEACPDDASVLDTPSKRRRKIGFVIHEDRDDQASTQRMVQAAKRKDGRTPLGISTAPNRGILRAEPKTDRRTASSPLRGVGMK